MIRFIYVFLLCLSGPVWAKRPNILFIFSDDHAYQAISAYGSNRNQTPNLDRLAKEGKPLLDIQLTLSQTVL
jgi:hypothetical protein